MQTLRKFSKYHGAGNDFILVEDEGGDFPIHKIPHYCDRRFGIGADGFILSRTSYKGDAKMVYFNADGSQGALCGNGLRCFVHFLHDIGKKKGSYLIEVADQLLTVKWDHGTIVTLLPHPRLIEWEAKIAPYTIYAVDTGVPHLVLFAKGEVDVAKEGAKLRHDLRFHPEGANVNFVFRQVGGFHYRTYERGVEGETLACGTGAAAIAYVVHKLGFSPPKVSLTTKSKEQLTVHIQERDIEIEGPSLKVFDGHLQE